MLFRTEDLRIRILALLLMISASAAFLAACTSELGVEEQLYQCATDQDCGDGLECYTGLCADKDEFAQRCRQYCNDFFDNCSALVGDRDKVFLDRDECQGVCEAYPINGTDGDESGNSLQCRLLHMKRAERASGPSEKLSHCGHSSPSGARACGDAITTKKCLFYCHDLMDRCTGENRKFDTPQRCLETCRGYVNDGTLECRRAALPEPDQEFEVKSDCIKAGPESPICEPS